MAMLNWNDYRNQILARVGEIGKLVSRDAMEYPLSTAVHHRGRSGVLMRLRPAEKTSFETTPDLASIRRSERVLLRNSSLQSNARQIAGARSCMVQPSRPR